MSDLTSTEPSPGILPNTDFVRTWRQTPTLAALRELLTVSSQVAPTVARRARLSHSELRALELLVASAHGPVELGRELGVTSAAASGIVDRLEARGHVVRQAHESDRRRTQVSLTDSGREEVLGYLVPMFAALARLDAEFTPEEHTVVLAYLRGAIDAIRRIA